MVEYGALMALTFTNNKKNYFFLLFAYFSYFAGINLIPSKYEK